MTHLQMDLSANAMVAFIRALRSIGVEAMAAANPGDTTALTAKPDESVLASFHTPILRRLLERAIAAMDEADAADHARARHELDELLTVLRERMDVAVCVLLVPPADK